MVKLNPGGRENPFHNGVFKRIGGFHFSDVAPTVLTNRLL